MNIVVGSAALIVAAAVVYIAIKPQPADEYPVSMASAYNRLASTTLDLSHGRKGPFGGLSTSVSGNGHNQIEWKAGGTFAAFDCTLNLAPLGDTRTKVAVSCTGSGGDAAEGLLMTMARNAVIEQVDSTLKNRAYDIELAKGATASRWPDDIVHHAGIHESIGNAIRMQADIADEQRKAEQAFKDSESEHESATYGQPSMQTVPTEPEPATNP